MEQKISRMLARLAELENLLGQPHVFEDQKKYRVLNQEYAHLAKLKAFWDKKSALEHQIHENEEMLKEEKELSFATLVRDENRLLEEQLSQLQLELEQLLIPPNPQDHRPTILELRAGTGGDEAAIFVGDCVRMYKLFADRMGWSCETLSYTASDLGGFKEYVMVMSGENVHRLMQYEAGTHRVQRVPKTEAMGRVHTSAITIAVFAEPEEGDEIVINDKDLRVDTYRSSGAGGQHVNKTDSAVRLTHLPSGIVVACQQERSQHKNKEQAMRLLKAKLLEAQEQEQQQAQASVRSQQVGSGDRSERIRTYNFSQNRLTDHRIDLTLYNLDQVMEGDLKKVSEALVAHFHAAKLAA